MTTFWERAAHSVYRVFSLYFDLLLYLLLPGWFDGGTLILVASVPGRCFSFTF